MKNIHTKCLFCLEQKESKYIHSHTDKGVVYHLYECSNCYVQYWLPLHNPGSEWYETDYRYSNINKDPNLNPLWNHTKVISFLSPFVGSVLDIGCGTGSFLYWAKLKGWKVQGIDFDRSAIDTAKDVFQISDVEVNDLKSYFENNKNKKFDLITFFDVFEHIDNHREFVGMITTMLNSGGSIALSMPYREGAMWLKPNDLPPRHLTRWNRKSISIFLESNGYKVSYITRRSEGLGHIILKLRFRYGKYFSFNMVNKVKKVVRDNKKIVIGSNAEKKINLIQRLATFKDWTFFGIPAVFIWCYLILQQKQYITLYVIAQKK